MPIRKVKLKDLPFLRGKTKKKDVDAMGEGEILKGAMRDPDSPVPTPRELREFKRAGRKRKQGKRGKGKKK